MILARETLMNPGIFLIQENGDLVEMNEQPYDSEDLLQTLLTSLPRHDVLYPAVPDWTISDTGRP